jgi:hypothetical protein
VPTVVALVFDAMRPVTKSANFGGHGSRFSASTCPVQVEAIKYINSVPVLQLVIY